MEQDLSSLRLTEAEVLETSKAAIASRISGFALGNTVLDAQSRKARAPLLAQLEAKDKVIANLKAFIQQATKEREPWMDAIKQAVQLKQLQTQIEAAQAEIAVARKHEGQLVQVAIDRLSKITCLEREAQALREALADIDDAFTRIECWTKAYSESIPFFAPLSKTEVQACVKAMIEHSGIDAPSDRMHAQWARHIVKDIQGNIDAARALLKAPDAKEQG